MTHCENRTQKTALYKITYKRYSRRFAERGFVAVRNRTKVQCISSSRV